MSLDEVRESILGMGQDREKYPNWDTSWRLHLIGNFAVLVGQLRKVGVTNVFMNGSFVEDKDHPNDIDGYFTCDVFRLISGDLQRELNLLDPYKIWTWKPSDRRRAIGFPKRQLPMWHQYRVELYPHMPGLPTNIRDKYGHDLDFPSAFRLSRRDGTPKGIIKVGGLA